MVFHFALSVCFISEFCHYLTSIALYCEIFFWYCLNHTEALCSNCSCHKFSTTVCHLESNILFLQDAALNLGVLSEKEFEELVVPEKMVGPSDK